MSWIWKREAKLFTPFYTPNHDSLSCLFLSHHSINTSLPSTLFSSLFGVSLEAAPSQKNEKKKFKSWKFSQDHHLNTLISSRNHHIFVYAYLFIHKQFAENDRYGMREFLPLISLLLSSSLSLFLNQLSQLAFSIHISSFQCG